MKWIFGIALPLLLISPFYLNYSGFCWSDRQFMTDAKMIHSAMGEIVSLNNSRRVDSMAKQPIPYLDIEDFKRENPDCCRIHAFSGDGPPFPLRFADLLLGRVHDWIVVTWRQRYLNSSGQREDIFKTSYLYLGNCGKTVN
jgi:hypothetical protein